MRAASMADSGRPLMPDAHLPDTSAADGVAARYEALIRVSEALRRHHDLDTLFRRLAQDLRPVVRFDVLGLALLDDRTGTVTPRVLDGSGAPAPVPQLTSDQQLTHWVIAHQQPLVIPNLDEETRFAEEMTYLRGRGTRSACCLLLATPQRRIGMLMAASRAAHEYADDDVAFLSLVANQVALAIDDAQNHDALQASLALERDRLRTPGRLGRAVARAVAGPRRARRVPPRLADRHDAASARSAVAADAHAPTGHMWWCRATPAAELHAAADRAHPRSSTLARHEPWDYVIDARPPGRSARGRISATAGRLPRRA